MNQENQENLTKLFAKFFDAGQAERYAEEFRETERILTEHPAPPPDERLIADIKAKIAFRLSSRREKRFRRLLYEAVGVAAVIAILAIMSVQLFNKPGIPPKNGVYTASLLPQALWESDNIAVDDTQLAVYTAEVDQIENEVATLQTGDEPSESENTITELEMELTEINSDFWKG